MLSITFFSPVCIQNLIFMWSIWMLPPYRFLYKDKTRMSSLHPKPTGPIILCCVFWPAFGCKNMWFQPWNHLKSFEMNKKGWKTAEKMFRPAFGCAQHPKAGRNTQQSLYIWHAQQQASANKKNIGPIRTLPGLPLRDTRTSLALAVLITDL